MGALHDLSALEQASAIAAGDVSAVELVEHYLARSAEVGPELGAFAALLPELALEQARAADAAAAAARAAGVAPSSPLLGVVCPVKDLDFIAGVPSRMGSAAVSITMPTDSNVVAAMRAAGLVFSGKTATPEFGLPCYTEPDGAPPARNPWQPQLSPAGSSGGAAAAVAAGLAPIAQGSDGGGSIRLPAGACGLVGIKPSRGRISNGPFGYDAGDLAVHGPLARTVADAAALLDAMAVDFIGDPYRARRPGGTFLSAVSEPPGPLRVGFYTEPVVGTAEPSEEVLEAVASAVGLLSELGHVVEPIPVPIRHEAVALFEVLWAGLATSVEFPPEIEEQLTPLTRHLRTRARGATAGQLAAAISEIRALARDAMVATDGYDVVLSPTAARRPFEVGSMRDDADPAGDFEAQKQWASYTAVYNVTGQPAITVPVWWTPDGVPIGVQFAGRRDEERTLISLAAQIEEARPWRQRRPSQW